MMSRSTLGRCGLAAAGFLLVASGALARAADDDFELADRLSRRGYTDLATELFNARINDPKATAAQKAEGQYGLALLVYGDARLLAAERNDKRRLPMDQVLKKFDEADAAFAKFIGDNPSHPRNLDAKLSRGKLLQDKAEYVNVCIESNWLPAGGAAGWQKQVADWYDTAIQLFEASEKSARGERDKLKNDRRDSGPEWDDVNDRIGLVWLYRLAALYGKGAALPKGDAMATAALNQCVKEGSDDFQWEYGESVRGLWAIHYAGLACAALDKPADAYSFLRTAASFTAEKDDSPAIQDITFQSYVELGKWCMRFGRRDKDDWPKKALEMFAGLDKAWPAWKKHPEGQRAGLQWARMQFALGQRDRALALVNELVKQCEESGSPTKFEATRALGEMIAQGGGGASGSADLDPATLTKIAKNKWNEQDFGGAIRAFQAVIASCDATEMDKFGWDAWDYIGRCYFQLGRFYESYLAFDQIEQAWRRDKANEKLNELTNETGYSRAGALDQVFRQTKDATDKATAAKALEDFTKDHPTSPRNLDSEARVASTKLKEAESLRDNPESYRGALLDALKAYESLDPKGKTAEASAAVIAQIHQKLGNIPGEKADVAALRKSIELADAWLGQKRAEATDSTVRRARDQGARTATLVALSARADLNAAYDRSPELDAKAKAAADLLAALDRLGPDFLKYATKGQDQLDQWRAEGLISAGKVDDADTLVGKLLTDNPEGKNNRRLAALMSVALDRRAQEQLAKGDDNGARGLFLRSARRAEWSLDNAKTRDGAAAPRDPEVVRAVALRYSKGGDFSKAEQLLLEAQKSYDGVAADGARTPEDRDSAARSSRGCRIELVKLLLRQSKYDAAIPQLEKEVAKDSKERDIFLKAMQTTDNYSDAKYRELLAKTDVNKALLDGLSDAYMRAPSKERAYAAVNLSYILTLTMPKDDRHGEEWIDFLMRRAEAYLLLAEYTRQPEHYRAAASTIRNQVIIPGHLDGYEATLPGSKKRAETIVGRAEDGLRKLGSK